VTGAVRYREKAAQDERPARRSAAASFAATVDCHLSSPARRAPADDPTQGGVMKYLLVRTMSSAAAMTAIVTVVGAGHKFNF
jgi:hypothetical protein